MKVAVLGTGSAGSRHLKALGTIPGVELVAIPVRSSRRTELENQGICTAATLPEAASNGAHALIIATKTARHAKDACCALEHGFEVLVEKPLALNASEAYRVCETASQLEHKVYVGCVLRFSTSLNKFRDLLEQVGQLHSVRIECQSYLPDWRPERPYQQSYSARAGEGGVLLDLIHELDYAGWLFGWPETLAGQVKNLGRLGIESEEVAELTWETEAGCTVSIHLDYLSRPARRQVRVYGELGTLEWDEISGTVLLQSVKGETVEFNLPQSRDEMFLAQDSAFLKAVDGGHESRLASAQEGVKALAICDAARLSSKSRREEEVAYP